MTFLIFQNLRLEKIDIQVNYINEMCSIMSLDLKKALYDVHPSYAELGRSKPVSISNSTLERLTGKVQTLNLEKKQRLRKVCISVQDSLFVETDISIHITELC